MQAVKSKLDRTASSLQTHVHMHAMTQRKQNTLVFYAVLPVARRGRVEGCISETSITSTFEY